MISPASQRGLLGHNSLVCESKRKIPAQVDCTIMRAGMLRLAFETLVLGFKFLCLNLLGHNSLVSESAF
jgi:hypothetical protein